MQKGKKIIVPGDGTTLWSMTHNTDFAKGIIGLFNNIKAIGHAFHITTDEVLTWDQILEIIAKATGQTPDVLLVSTDFICRFLPGERGGLTGDKMANVVYDNTKIKRFVPGFVATTSFTEVIAKAVEWFKAHPEECGIDDELNDNLDRIIEGFEAGTRLAGK